MTKQTLAKRIYLVLGLILLTLGGLIWAAAVFFLSARYTRRLWIITGAAALALVLSTGGAAWLIGGSIDGVDRQQFAAIYAGAALVLGVFLSRRYLFRRYSEPVHAAEPHPEMRYWQLSTGSRIAYVRFSAVKKTKQTPVIYLHGGPAIPTRAANIDLFCQLTEDGYDVYLYDQTGSGFSSRLKDMREYTLERNVADLEAIRKEIGAQQMVLAGTSWGAVLAFHYMAAHPDAVAQAVFLSPGVLGERKNMRYDYSRTASSEDDTVIFPPLRMVFAGMLARINPGAAEAFASQEEMGTVFDAFIRGPSLEYQSNCKGYEPDPEQSARGGGGNYYANLMILQSLRKAPDPRPKVEGSPTPALILRGECDYIPWEQTYSYRQTLPNSKLLIIPSVGHALTNGQTELLLSSMRAFLKGDPLPIEPHKDSQ